MRLLSSVLAFLGDFDNEFRNCNQKSNDGVASVPLRHQRRAEEAGQGSHHHLGIPCPRRLKGRVHSQLGKSDVDGVEGHLGVGDVAKGGAAGHVRAVGVALDGNPRPLADQAEECRRHAVGGVPLVGVVLHHHTAVHVHGVVLVLILGMVGMYPVGVVAGD